MDQQQDSNNQNAPTEQPTPQPSAETPEVQAKGFEGDPAELHVNVPDSWPGAFGLMKYSRSAVALNFWTLVGFWLLSVVVSTVLNRTGIIGHLVSILVSAFATAGYVLTFLAGVRGKKLDFADGAKEALPLTLKILGLEILVGLSLAVSFVLLVIPFFFVLPRLTLANYYLVDKNMDILEAYKASWHATKGFSGKIWGVIGVAILFAILIIVLVGIYLTIVYAAAFAVVYEYLNRRPQPQAVEATPETPPASPPPAV